MTIDGILTLCYLRFLGFQNIEFEFTYYCALWTPLSSFDSLYTFVGCSIVLRKDDLTIDDALKFF